MVRTGINKNNAPNFPIGKIGGNISERLKRAEYHKRTELNRLEQPTDNESEEVLKMAKLIRMRKNKDRYGGLVDLASYVISRTPGNICVELGSFGGEGTSILAPKFKKVICVDPYTVYLGDRAGSSFQLTEARKSFESFRMARNNVSHMAMSSIEASELFGGGLRAYDPSFDLVYVDARHDYQSVKDDIGAWWGMARFIGGHDYSHPRFQGVIRAVDEFLDILNHKYMPVVDEIERTRPESDLDSNKMKKTKLIRFRDTSWLIDLRP